MAGHRCSTILFFWATLCGATLSLFSQELNALRGRVLDPTGAPISGARITAAQSSTLSDNNGDFALPLAPGKYTLRVSKENFFSVSRDVDLLDAAAGVPEEIVLRVAAVHDAVTV